LHGQFSEQQDIRFRKAALPCSIRHPLDRDKVFSTSAAKITLLACSGEKGCNVQKFNFGTDVNYILWEDLGTSDSRRDDNVIYNRMLPDCSVGGCHNKAGLKDLDDPLIDCPPRMALGH
jgi:hypothetical protein